MQTIKIKSITLNNFQSYSHLELNFPENPGFYFVKGKNLKEPEMGSEGVGKSSLFDAVCWAFYGKTPKGFKASDIVSWSFDKKSTSVTVQTNLGTLIREQSPNALLWQGAPMDQIHLNKMLGLSYEQFIITTIHGQDLDFFLEKKGAEQSEFLTDVLGLNRWDLYQQKAKDLLKSKQSELATLQMTQKNLEGQIQQIQSLNWEKECSEWEKERKNALKKIDEEKKKLQQESSEKEKEKESLTKKLADLLLTLPKEKPQEENLVPLRNNQQKLTQTLGELSAEKQSVMKWIAYFTKTPSCATCLQPISEEHSQKHIKDFKEKEMALTEDIEFTEKRRTAITEKITTLTRDLENYRMRVHSVEKERIALTTKKEGVEKELKRIKSLMDSYESQKNQTVVNPFLKKKEETERKLAELKAQLTSVKDSVNTLFHEIDHYSFWVQGFRDIKISQFQYFLEQLENEANILLKKLEMVSWKFSISSQTNNAGYTTISIDASHEGKIAPLSRYSGGEGVRLKIVFQMALGGLLQRITETSFSLEVFDEPFRYLSENGIKMSLDILKEYSLFSEKQVYLIDHSVHSYGEFDGEIMVIKDSEGSHASWE